MVASSAFIERIRPFPTADPNHGNISEVYGNGTDVGVAETGQNLDRGHPPVEVVVIVLGVMIALVFVGLFTCSLHLHLSDKRDARLERKDQPGEDGDVPRGKALSKFCHSFCGVLAKTITSPFSPAFWKESGRGLAASVSPEGCCGKLINIWSCGLLREPHGDVVLRSSSVPPARAIVSGGRVVVLQDKLGLPNLDVEMSAGSNESGR